MTTEADQKRERAHKAWQSFFEKNTANPWAGWQAMLKNAQFEGVGVPVDPNTPFQGYYRSKLQDKTFEPVHFFKNAKGNWAVLRPWRSKAQQLLVQEEGEGRTVTRKDGTTCTEFQLVMDSWIYISRYPVNHSFYQTAVETKAWPDQDALTTSEALKEASKPNEQAQAQREAAKTTTEEKPAPNVEIRNRLDNAIAGAKAYEKITTPEEQSKALSVANLIAGIGREALKHRTALSEPHNEALKKIREVWSPLVNEAQGAVSKLEAEMSNFATFQVREARRKAEEELAALEAAQKVEAAKLKIEQAEQTGLIFDEGQPPSPPPPPPPPAPAPTTQAPSGKVQTSYGRSATVKAEWTATEITDIKVVLGFLTNNFNTAQAHAELKTKVLELAARAKNAGYEVPGVKFEETAKVKR